MSRRILPALGLLGGLLVPAITVRAQDANWTKPWPGYTVIVWRFKTPPPGPELKSALESAGLHAVHLDGGRSGVSPATVEFVLKYDLANYLDHAAGKGYLHLVEPAKSQVMHQREPVARPFCFSDPETMTAMKKLIKMNVEAAAKTRCVGYAFDDEISAVSFTSPCDTCTSPLCLERFRRLLKDTYKNIDALNAQWDTDHESFDAVTIVGAEATRLANHEKPLGDWNLSGWVDSREYIDANFADTLKELVAYTNKLDPTRPAGYVGGGGPTAYGGYDYEKICKVIQWIEAYDIGGTDAILRSLMPGNPRVQTWFDNGSVEKNKWFNWYYWANGDRGQIIWPATGETNPWFPGPEAREDIQALKPMLEETQGAKLGRLLVGADYAHDGIALYLSQPSIRVSWFIDILPHKDTWINRSSSINNGNDTAHWNRYGWMKLLEDCGLSYNFVTPSQVVDGELLKKKYKVLILGRALAMSDAEARAIRKFADAGGMVIADHLCGLFDQHGKARSAGALDELFGVSHDLSRGLMNGKVLYEIDAERFYDQPLEKKVTTAYDGAPTHKDLVVYERGLEATAGKPTATVEDEIPVLVRRGKAVYLNLSPVSHCILRYNPKRNPWPDLILPVLAEAGVKPRAQVLDASLDEPEPIVPIVQYNYWKLRGGRTALCIVKSLFRSAQINAAGPTQGKLSGEPMKIRLVFAKPVKGLKNERTGKTLGDGQKFDDAWIPCEANVYTFE